MLLYTQSEFNEGVNQVNALRYIFSPRMLVPIAAVAATVLAGFALVSQSPVKAANCTTNDVIKCGYSTPTDLANKTAASAELKALYNHQFTPGYGIGDLAYWKSHAKHATVYKTGRVVLDNGTIIGTGAYSLGREAINGNRIKITIGTHVYYYGKTTDNFAGTSIPAYVLQNPDDHSLKFAALTPCGNPVWATSPAYKCKMLNAQKVNSTTYNFTTTVYNKNTTLTKLVYAFGDGQTKTVTSNFGQVVTHTYAPGKWTAKVTAYFTANGQTQSDTRTDCTKPIDVPKPPVKIFSCTGLEGKLIEGNRKYSFTATGHYENGPKLVSASFDFDDKTTADNQTNVVTKDANNATITVPHTYAASLTGKVHITADLKFTVGQDTKNAKCATDIELKARTCKDTPNAPECQPPKTCKDTPTAPECQPPKTCKQLGTCKEILPSTGPEDLVMSAVGLGSFAGAGMYYRSTRREWINNIFKRK